MENQASVGRTIPLRHLDEDSVMWRRAGYVFDTVMLLLASLGPKVPFRAASFMAPCAMWFGAFSGTAADLERLLEPIVQGDPGKITREICATVARNRVLSRLVLHAGHDAVAPLLTAASLERIQRLNDTGRPAIIGAIHSGPVLAITSALHLLGIPATVLTIVRHHYRETPLEIVSILQADLDAIGSSHLQSAALCRQRLKSGGLVFIPLDGTGKEVVEVSLLGRRLVLPAGAAVLSAMTGAPIVPVEAKWTPGSEIELVVGEPFFAPGGEPPRDAEYSLIRQVMEHFDRSLRADPGQLNLTLLDQLLQAPVS